MTMQTTDGHFDKILDRDGNTIRNAKNVTCNKCGWVYFQVSREYAENEVATFNEYFDSLEKEKQDQFYGGNKSKVENYDHCWRCGNDYKNFRDSVEGDVPRGSTINPIIDRRD